MMHGLQRVPTFSDVLRCWLRHAVARWRCARRWRTVDAHLLSYCLVDHSPRVLFIEAASEEEAERLKPAFPLADFDNLDCIEAVSRTVELAEDQEMEPAYTRTEALEVAGELT